MSLVVFEDLPSTNTPLNAQNLNNNFNELASNIVKEETLTILTSGWTQNQSTGYYEYTVTNQNITANHIVNIYMDIENQAKMTGSAYTLSYDGGFKVITNEAPEENITATITYGLTEGVSV